MAVTATNPATSPILASLSQPGKITDKQELRLRDDGELAIMPADTGFLSFILNKLHPRESEETVLKIADVFARRVIHDVTQFEKNKSIASLNFPVIYDQFKMIENNLLSRTTGTTKDAVKTRMAVARFKIQSLERKKFPSKFEGLSERVTRYALYKLIEQGYPVSIGASILGLFPKAADKVSQAATCAATATANATTKATSTIAPVLSNYLPGVLTFLLVTEGPGAVGYFVRKLTPNRVKNVYTRFTPTLLQGVVNYLFKTPQYMESGFNWVGQKASSILS